MKIFRKSLSIILVILTIFTACSVAMPVFAESVVSANKYIENETDRQERLTSNIKNEVTELREEYAKHFLCEDGSYIVATYSSPVHYEENGVWKEIDNRFEPVSGNIFNIGATEYSPKAGNKNFIVPKNFANCNSKLQ